MFGLRHYQLKGKNMMRDRLIAGDRRIMLWCQTGGGKGFIMSDLNFDCLKNGSKILNIMRRRKVIQQTVKNYKKYHKINASPLMGTSKGFDSNNSCQVASIDTIAKRVKNGTKYDFLKEFDIIIIDECHDLVSSDYKRFIWWLEGYNPNEFTDKLFEEQKHYFKKIYIGLTATPFRVGRRTHTFWQSVVKPIEAHELRDEGVLVPIRVYAPKKIDVKGIRIINGDFEEKVLLERVTQLEVIGDVVNTYRELGQNKSAICFCINTKHAQIMTKAFNMAGIPAVYCDSNHTEQEREDAINGAKSGRYKILVNCNLWSTGFDAPWIEVEISCRPSDSENLVCQQWGRVLRPYKICGKCKSEYGGDPTCFQCGSNQVLYEKKYAILLDHGNNTGRWGMPYDIRQAELEPIDSQNKRARGFSPTKDCPKCYGTVGINEKFCVCGYDFDEAKNNEEIVHTRGELHEVDANSIKQKEYQTVKQRYNSFKRIEILNNIKPIWKYHKLYEEFGDKLFNYCADFGITIAMKKEIEFGNYQRTQKEIEERDAINNYKNQKVFT